MVENYFVDETIKVVIVGHVDHGKSTLIGRLIHDLNQIPEGKLEELTKISSRRGMDFEWAFLLDALQTERNQGITIDTTQIFFKTKKRNYILIDAPGHQEFLRNMITGASSAEIAILIIDAVEGIKEQTKKHAYLLKLLGIKEIIVLINKMDAKNYERRFFQEIKKELDNFLKILNLKKINTIPISAKEGENINNKSQKMKWFHELNLVDTLDNIDIVTDKSIVPLRIPVQDIYKFNEKRIIVGKIETGRLSVGDEILVSPSNSKSKIKSIEVWPKKKKTECVSGECIGLTLNDKIFVERGNIISHVGKPPQLTSIFEANIFWLSLKKLSLNRHYRIRIATSEYKINFKKILKIIDTHDLSNKSQLDVEKNDVAEVVISSNSLISADNFKQNSSMGRFSIIDNFEVVGGGIIDLKKYPNQRNLKSSNPKNIVPTKSLITEAERTSRSFHRPGIVWFTGLSGSGKSTIAKQIEKKLFQKGYNVFILDGDNLRNGLNKDLTFSPSDRMENIRRTGEVARLFSLAGYIVIISLISPYKTERQKARDIRPEIFREIFIKASIDECIKRDVKGLYALALKGEIRNFTGLSSPYEEPENPDLVLNTENNSVEEVVSKLEKFIVKEFGIINT